MKKSNSQNIKQELFLNKNSNQAKLLMRFFKTGKGEYGEGDLFLGLKVPTVRQIVKKYYSVADIADALELMPDPYHEVRLTGILLSVAFFEKAREGIRRTEIVEAYLSHKKHINNWDLVDLSADKILGRYYFQKDTTILDQLVRSPVLWDRRIAVLSTFWFIREGDYRKSLEYAEILLSDKQDLMHKAVGWMLREIGKRDKKVLTGFLDQHAKHMPRTMLRYAIEKFPEEERKKYLQIK